MLSSALRGSRAAQVNVELMRTFVRLREILSTHKDLARKLADLESKNARQVYSGTRFASSVAMRSRKYLQLSQSCVGFGIASPWRHATAFVIACGTQSVLPW